MIRNILLVGMGGAVGSMMRYGVTLVTNTLHGTAYLATLIVNILGSLLMGYLIACGQHSTSPWLLFATVGLCGGFTTFSTFSMQSVTLLQQGRYGSAALYIAASLICCLIGCFIGYKLKN